jgi:hypothetical protein
MAAKNPSSPLSLDNIPKPCLDFVLHYLLLRQIKKGFQPENFSGQEPHKFLLFQYYKNFCLMSRLKGSALCLVKTQYAKKPKNPE